jgi:glutamate-1-semialdehyde 2,1-aminomutase
MNRDKSRAVYEKLCKVIPAGVNSPVRTCKAVDQLPLVAERASGDTVYDVDGHAYVDYCCSWGALVHGHAHPEIMSAVHKRMLQGTSFGITSSIEEQLASKVVNTLDSIDKIRFVSSGTEATMSALRLARGFTGRRKIIKFTGNYHGHADFLLVQAGSGVFGLTASSSSAGIPDDSVKHTICLPYNDIEAFETLLQDAAIRDDIAAVIIEPVAGNMGVVPVTQAFITYLRRKTKEIGALLIFDEVITGFRVGFYGAQKHYGITPDLTCLGKIVGGGFPAAAFGGREEIMSHLAPLGKVYQAGTLSGNPVAMEAGLQSIRLLEKPGVYEELARKADVIIGPVQRCIEEKGINACIQRVGSMFTLFFGQRQVRNMEEAKQLDEKRYAACFQHLFRKGIYVPPSQYEAWFVSTVHEEKNLEKTRDALLEFLLLFPV